MTGDKRHGREMRGFIIQPQKSIACNECAIKFAKAEKKKKIVGGGGEKLSPSYQKFPKGPPIPQKLTPRGGGGGEGEGAN